MERRLAAILFADIVGFSRLMGEDEAGTLLAIETLTQNSLTPLISRHRGRVVKLLGDGFLVEFSSVVDALACALDWQERVGFEENDHPSTSKLRFRIGINLGDIIAKGDDIHGDGVNIAMRLETMADSGSVLVASTVFDHTAGKLEAHFEDLGQHQLKNIVEPIHVYRVSRSEIGRTQRVKSKVTRKTVLFAGIVALVLLVAGLTWYQPGLLIPMRAEEDVASAQLPDRPSIVVLPFEDLSDDKSQEYFTDGITEDLATDLAKISELFVVAPHTSFSYKGQSYQIQDVANELGVKYVLDGSVRRSGDRLRLTAQLIDSTSGSPVWADKFNGELQDVFAVQDEFVMKIVEALALQLTTGERSNIERQDTSEISAREAFQQGWELYSQFTEADSIKAVKFFEKAVELDPKYGRAYGALALVHQRNGIFRWNHDPSDPRNEVYVKYVRPNLNKAEEFDEPLTHLVQAMRHLNFRGQVTGETGGSRINQAKEATRQALEMLPNDAEAHLVMAWALLTGGSPQEALEFINTAKRLNPDHQSYYYLFEASAHYGLGDLSEAARILNDALEKQPDAIELMPFAASFNAQMGNRKRANALVERWVPGQYQELREAAAARYFPPVQWEIELDHLNERLLDGLNMAALPPEITVQSLRLDLKQQDPSEQVESIRKLGWFGPSAASAVPDLVVALGSSQNKVKREAAISLGKIGPAAQAATAELEAITEKPLVGYHAQNALRKIRGE